MLTGRRSKALSLCVTRRPRLEERKRNIAGVARYGFKAAGEVRFLGERRVETSLRWLHLTNSRKALSVDGAKIEGSVLRGVIGRRGQILGSSDRWRPRLP
jgi:hypothetical protein